jgi:hypothetical protein
MRKKGKLFLALAAIALLSSMVFRFAFATPANDLSDFAIGLGAAFMLGVLITWRKPQIPNT